MREGVSPNGDIKLRWVAGYTKEIDFVNPSVLDTLFWNLYMTDAGTTDLKKIGNVCTALLEYAGGLVKELGFKVLAYDGSGGASNPIRDLTKKPGSEE